LLTKGRTTVERRIANRSYWDVQKLVTEEALELILYAQIAAFEGMKPYVKGYVPLGKDISAAGRSCAESGSTSSLRVSTVLGPVKPEDLGVTLTHEHIFIDLRFDGTGVDGVLDDVGLAIDELRLFQQAGGAQSSTSPTNYLGRSAAGQIRVARETGLHIIASTGYYRMVYYPAHVNELTINKLGRRHGRRAQLEVSTALKRGPASLASWLPSATS